MGTLTRFTEMKILETKTTARNKAAPKVTIMNKITATCLDRLSRLLKMEKADMNQPNAEASKKRPPVTRYKNAIQELLESPFFNTDVLE